MFRALIAVLLLCGTAGAQMGANLVPPSSATDTAVQSGKWHDTTTWADGTVPVAGERVFIPAGFTVANHGTTADVLWIHAAGVLTCCDHCDVQFNAHTIYIPMGGAFRIGMAGMPATGSVGVEFPPGPFLPGDTTKLSRGVINHGEFTVCGVEKTHADIIDGDLPIGATSLKLLNVPYGWKVGDRILIAGTDFFGTVYQTEERTIAAVNGRTVSWAEPLVHRHFRWRPDLVFHCLNLTRNIVIRSRDTSTIENRGHVMSMSSANNLSYCRIEGCGRTDKSKDVTDPRLDTYGELIAGSDANPRARYPLHNHRVGAMGPPSSWRGVVVDGSPGWGMVNHASNVICEDGICVRCFGAGFVTEEGQERGAFRRCIAALNRGLGDQPAGDEQWGRRVIGDWGIAGDGFWLHSGLVEVSDCVAFDNSARGFIIFHTPLNSYPDYGQGDNRVKPWLQFPIAHNVSLLPEDYQTVEWWQANPKPTTIPSGYVPQRVFNRNSAYNNRQGLQAVTLQQAAAYWPLSVRGKITDLTIWGRGSIAHLEYAQQFDIDGLKSIGAGILRPTSQEANKPGLILRRKEVTVRRYEVVGQKAVLSGGTAAETATHRVYDLSGALIYPPQ